MKRLFVYIIILISGWFSEITAQQINISALDSVLMYSGLNRNDISLPLWFNDEDENLNYKLLIPQVKESLSRPLNSINFKEKISELKEKTFTENIMYLFGILKENFNYKSETLTAQSGLQEISGEIASNRKVRDNIRNKFSENQRNFLDENVLSLIKNDEDNTEVLTDIFLFNGNRDSSLAHSKRVLDILSTTDTELLFNSLISDVYLFEDLYEYVRNNPGYFDNLQYKELNESNLKGNYSILNFSGIEIIIGGKGKNIYNGNFDIIIDMGGDDVYEITGESKTNDCWIIDLSGNDYYTAASGFAVAGAYFSSSFILDAGGNDIYKGKNVSLGSAVAGVALLADINGDDFYSGDMLSCGAGMFGAGLLYDFSGNDIYSTVAYSQGFGLTNGIGMISDISGNDNYISNLKQTDITRYEDHYLFMSQGFGLGLRPYYAGGIGIILDGAGNDYYTSDIYGQGSAYWYASGYLIDLAGNDTYNSYQYSQGAGVHLASGFLFDDTGSDRYVSNSTSQGCGHDYAAGFLFDISGNDNYAAVNLSQGAGNANGIGLLFDLSGKDGYLNKDEGTTLGYGNLRRGTGSLGIFIDAGGRDFYTNTIRDSSFSTNSFPGIFSDKPFYEIQSDTRTEFKIPFVIRNYTIEELFIMAKTIEPRFSEWQEYGLNQMIADSVNSTEFLLKYLDSDDARVKLVLLNVFYKAGHTFTYKIREILPKIISGKLPAEKKLKILTYISYLLGEYGNKSEMDLLLTLSDYENIKVKSSAINALGKINGHGELYYGIIIDKIDTYKNIKTDYITFYRDVVICLKNYKSEKSFIMLLEYLKPEYHFSVRMPAIEALKEFNEIYSYLITGSDLKNFAADEIMLYGFVKTLSKTNEYEFERIFNSLENISSGFSSPVKYAVSEVLKERLKAGFSSPHTEYLISKLNRIYQK